MSYEALDSGDSSPSRIKREASEWAVKQSFGLTAEEQDAFFDWLSEDPDHSEAYVNAQKTWKHLDVLADWRPEHSLKPNPNLLDTAKPSRKKRIVKAIGLLGGIAASIAIALTVWQSFEEKGPQLLSDGAYADVYERHELEDGTVVELNRGAQAIVDYGNNLRQVTLSRGEAHFTVAKDASRPFVVIASGVAVQAVGTMFNVHVDDGSVDVIVTEGRVMVGHEPKDERVLDVENIGETVQELIAGQRAVVDSFQVDVMPAVIPVSQVEIEDRLTWLNRVLNFTDAPLSEVVREFNRRNKLKLVIEDEAIENLAINVTIQPENIEKFVSTLELTMDIEAERIGDSVIVLRSQ